MVFEGFCDAAASWDPIAAKSGSFPIPIYIIAIRNVESSRNRFWPETSDILTISGA